MQKCWWEGGHRSLNTNFGDFCTQLAMLRVRCTHVLHACISSLIGPRRTAYLDGYDTFYCRQSGRREITASRQEQEVSGGRRWELRHFGVCGCSVAAKTNQWSGVMQPSHQKKVDGEEEFSCFSVLVTGSRVRGTDSRESLATKVGSWLGLDPQPDGHLWLQSHYRKPQISAGSVCHRPQTETFLDLLVESSCETRDSGQNTTRNSLANSKGKKEKNRY